MKTHRFFKTGAASLAMVVGAYGLGGAAYAANPLSLDAPSPIEKPYKLRGGEAFDVDAFLAAFDADTDVSYDSAEFDKKLGAMVVTGLSLVDGETTISIERAEIYGADLDALSRLANAKSKRDKARFEKIVDKARLFNVVTEKEGNAWTLDAYEVDKLFAQASFLNEFSWSGDDTEYLSSVRLNGAYASGFGFDVSDPATGRVNASVADLRLVGVKDGRADAQLVKDVAFTISDMPVTEEATEAGEYQPEVVDVKVERYEWRDYDVIGLSRFIGDNPELSDERVDLGSLTTVNTSISLDGSEMFRIGRISVPVMKFAWFIPAEIKFEVEDFGYDFTNFPAIRDQEPDGFALLEEAGLLNVSIDGASEWSWDPASGDGAASGVSSYSGLFSDSGEVRFTGVTLEELRNVISSAGDPDAGTEAVMALLAEKLKLSSFEYGVLDEGVLQKAFDIVAGQMAQGGTPMSGNDLRQSMPLLMRATSSQYAQLHERVPGYIDAVVNFVSKGGRLMVSATPEKPVGAADFEALGEDPTAAIDLLDLNITQSK